MGTALKIEYLKNYSASPVERKMSDYSEDDFEASNGLNAYSKNNYAAPKPAALPVANRAKNQSPFRTNGGGYSIGTDDEIDDYDGYAPGGQAVNSDDAYEDDDFDEEEEEQFKKTAVEFAKKLSALRQSAQLELVEGGEDPNKPLVPEESKGAPGRPTCK